MRVFRKLVASIFPSMSPVFTVLPTTNGRLGMQGLHIRIIATTINAVIIIS
jgi:hypothetical protein